MSTERLVWVIYLLFRLYNTNIDSGRWTFCHRCNCLVAAGRRCERWTCVDTEVTNFTY